MSDLNQTRQALETFYAAFNRGDYAAALAVCDPKVTFQIAGKSKLAGKYTSADFSSGLGTKLKELSGGQYKLEVHDILVSDRHAVAMASVKFNRGSEKIEYRTAQVWRVENGKPIAGYEYLRDMYQFDTIWS